MDTEFQLGKIKKFGDGGSDGHTTQMYLMPLNCIPINDVNSKFCYIYFTTMKKIRINLKTNSGSANKKQNIFQR